MTTRQAKTTPDLPYRTIGPDDAWGPTSQAVIYLFEARNGEIIYVGQTTNWPIRRDSHSKKPWWKRIVRVHVIPASDMKDRMDGESFLIRLLQPSENKAGTSHQAVQKASARRSARSEPKSPEQVLVSVDQRLAEMERQASPALISKRSTRLEELLVRMAHLEAHFKSLEARVAANEASLLSIEAWSLGHIREHEDHAKCCKCPVHPEHDFVVPPLFDL